MFLGYETMAIRRALSRWSFCVHDGGPPDSKPHGKKKKIRLEDLDDPHFNGICCGHL
jgi:hypothetical protein